MVGQLNDAWGHYDGSNNGEIIGCSFVGSVKAVAPTGYEEENEGACGSYAGGICGFVAGGGVADPEISLSYANATLEGTDAYGLAYFSDMSERNTSVYGSYSDIYVKGEVNDNNIDTYGEISNISSGNRYENTNHNSVEINTTLNDVVDDNPEADEKIYFSRETGEIILVFGQPSEDEDLGDDYIDNEDVVVSVCEPLQGAITIERRQVGYTPYYSFHASWLSNQGDKWEWVLKRDDGSPVTSVTTTTHSDNSNEVEVTLGYTANWGRINADEYIFSVRRVCSEEEKSSYTYETFKVNNNNEINNGTCSSVANLAVRDITTNSAVVSWTSTSNSCKYRIDGGNYTTILYYYSTFKW